MNCLCCHCGRPAQRAGRRTGFVASPRSCECLCGPGLRSFSPRFCWSDTEPHTVFVLCQSVLRCVRPWVTLFQLFSNILHLFKCNAIDQSSVSESFLSTDFYRKWFSSNIPHDMLPACLPALRVSQGMDCLSNLSILGESSSLCFYDLEAEESRGMVHGRRTVFWLGVWPKTCFSSCTFQGLCHTIG